MGRVVASVVSSASPEKLYCLGQDLHKYSSMFPNLKEIVIVQRSDDGSVVVSEWTAQAKLIIRTHTMTWRQRDEWDHENMRLCFSKADGFSSRFKHLRGSWDFKPHTCGTQMVIDTDFEIDHPLMTPAIHKIIDKLMQKNNESMLLGLKKLAEKP